jgi:hypothetical protein
MPLDRSMLGEPFRNSTTTGFQTTSANRNASQAPPASHHAAITPSLRPKTKPPQRKLIINAKAIQSFR